MKTQSILLGLAATTSALPSSNFDDLTNVVAGLAPAIQPLGAYGALTYQDFVWFPGSLGSLLLPPPSAPNVISTGVASQTLYGSAALLPDPSTSTFSLKPIYYACGVDTEASTGALMACTTQFSGVKAAGGETVMRELVFDPALLINKYNKTKFADMFGGLERVDFTVIASTVTPELTVPLFDNVEYDACLKA